MDFVIADTHFYHKNIIDYCKRPFNSVEQMNIELIKNWNDFVSNKDTIYVLGDFALTNKEKIKELCEKLNGKKILIKGNHDNYSNQTYRDCGFYEVSEYPILYKNFFWLSHEPLVLNETTPYANIYGHVHNDEKYHNTLNSKCVSVERTMYRPISIDLLFTIGD